LISFLLAAFFDATGQSRDAEFRAALDAENGALRKTFPDELIAFQRPKTGARKFYPVFIRLAQYAHPRGQLERHRNFRKILPWPQLFAVFCVFSACIEVQGQVCLPAA
jgi:hypothetical protein